MKVNYDLLESIYYNKDFKACSTWADACRKVYETTYTILEMNRLEHVAKIHELADNCNKLKQELDECKKELNQLKNPLSNENSSNNLEQSQTHSGLSKKLNPLEDLRTSSDVVTDTLSEWKSSEVSEMQNPKQEE